jgi:hypothetical protein
MFINKAPNIYMAFRCQEEKISYGSENIYKDMLIYRRIGFLMVRDIPSTNNF